MLDQVLQSQSDIVKFDASPNDLFEMEPYKQAKVQSIEYMFNGLFLQQVVGHETKMTPVAYLLQFLNSDQKFVENTAILLSDISEYAQQFQITFSVYEEQTADYILECIPQSNISIHSFEQKHHIKNEFSFSNVVDAFFVSRHDNFLTGVKNIDIVVRTQIPIKIESSKDSISNIVKVMRTYIDDEFGVDIIQTEGDNSSKMTVSFTRIEPIDVIYKKSQGYVRSIFMHKAFSLVTFPEDIKFFWINQSATKEHHVPFCSLVKLTNVLFTRSTNTHKLFPIQQKVQKQQVKKLQSFKDSEQLWEYIKSVYEYELWCFGSSLQDVSSMCSNQGGNSSNLFSIRPKDYRQTGFIDPIITYVLPISNDVVVQTRPQETNEQQHSWLRNRGFNVISRAFFCQTIEDCRQRQQSIDLFLSGSNFGHVYEKYKYSLMNLSVQHMTTNEAKEDIHPHPCVQFKQNLFNGFPLTIQEPLTFGPSYFLSGCTSMYIISQQLFMQDSHRTCNNGAIFLCGVTRSGKSMIKESVNKFFGGYEWRKTNGNFQSKTLLSCSVVTIDEMEIDCLCNEKKGSCYWKKRLDQATSCDIDLKCKDGRQCMRYVPFIVTTNEDVRSISQKVEECFAERIQPIQFQFGVLDFIKSISDIDYKYHKNTRPEWDAHVQLMDQWKQQAEIANQLCLFHFLFPVNQSVTYFLDDTITEHILKILYVNKHSPFLYMYFKRKGFKYMKKIFDAVLKLNRLHQDGKQMCSNNWDKFLFQVSRQCPEYDQFISEYIKMGAGNEVDENCHVQINKDETREVLLDQFAKISLNIFYLRQHKQIQFYDTMDDLRDNIVRCVPESNQKRHMLTTWDRILVRLGL